MRFNWTGLLLGIAAFALLPIAEAGASSRTTVWSLYFQKGVGARLIAKRVVSFLGSDQPSERLIFSAVCSPNAPVPTVSFPPPFKPNAVIPQESVVKVLTVGDRTFYYNAVQDRVATQNAGDGVPRFSFVMNTGDPLFYQLSQGTRRTEAKLTLRDGGTQPVEIYKAEDRAKVRNYISICDDFWLKNKEARNTQPSVPDACGDHLRGPNPFNGKGPRNYTNAIVDQVCGNYLGDPRPAQCMHYVMAGNLAWNREGNTGWVEDNAARLCHEITDYAGLANCFSAQIRAGIDWDPAITICRAGH